jgi:transcriptional regulator with XRE-family HTH domain
MSQEDIFINGELLRLRREARGWVINDLATRACMSVKQIRQLEEGGISSFYSLAVKMTSAKKVGALLGLSAEEVFAKEVEPTPELEIAEPEVVSALDIKPANIEPVSHEAAHTPVEMKTTNEFVSSESVASVPVVDEPKSKTSLWVIAFLFAAALAVAAYMQPKDEPVAETPPPIQVLPTEVTDPASAASGAESTASSAEAMVLPASATAVVGAAAVNVQKPASSVSVAASATRIAAPVASGMAPVITRPASSSMAIPAAPSASKTP